MNTEIETKIKWQSKFNNGDQVRHICDECEKGIITGVLFDSGSPPQYRVSNGAKDQWWHEIEVVRLKVAK